MCEGMVVFRYVLYLLQIFKIVLLDVTPFFKFFKFIFIGYRVVTCYRHNIVSTIQTGTL